HFSETRRNAEVAFLRGKYELRSGYRVAGCFGFVVPMWYLDPINMVCIHASKTLHRAVSPKLEVTDIGSSGLLGRGYTGLRFAGIGWRPQNLDGDVQTRSAESAPYGGHLSGDAAR